MGVAGYRILGDVALETIASGRIRDRYSLARVPGVGPRLVAKFGSELLSLVERES
jgi:DNA topoisomerase-3